MADSQTVESPSVVWATAEHATCTRHRQYHLTCDQFDELLKRADGHCEICEAESQPQIKGCCLAIDHEHFVGQWAVRGLLCYVCNNRLSINRRIPPDPRIQRYIANAWYVGELKRCDLSADRPPEPGVGSAILGDGHSWERFTDRREDCWVSRSQNSYRAKSWSSLWWEYGPLHTTIRCVRAQASESLIKELRRHAGYLLKDPAAPPRRVAAAVLDERIAMARAVLARTSWLKGDLKHVAELEGILAGVYRPVMPRRLPLPASDVPDPSQVLF